MATTTTNALATAPATDAPVTVEKYDGPRVLFGGGAPAPVIATGPVHVMAPATATAIPAPVKPGKLADGDRLVWLGASHVQKGNSGRYNEWMARAGTFTVQEAVAAGIPGHHVRYVTGQGWAVRA